MQKLPEPQSYTEIRELILKFNAIEKGQDIIFSEQNYIDLIDYYIIQTKNQKAFSVLNKALNSFPDSYDILLSEAQLLIEVEMNIAASKKLKKLYKLNPKDLGLIMLIGINYTKLAIINKAMMFFDTALGMIKNTNKELLLYSIAQTFIQAGRYDIATFYLSKAYQLKPNDKTIILDFALSLERSGYHKKAEKLYKLYLKKDPFSKIAWYNLGVVLANEQKVKEAIEAFDYAIAIDVKFSSPIFNKADLLFQTKEYSAAIPEFTKLLEIEKDNSIAFYKRGVSFFNIANWQEALKDIKRSLRINKDNNEAWYYMSIIYYSFSKLNKAKKALYKALKRNNLETKYWKLAAKIFVKEKNIKLAEKSFSLSLDADPFADKNWFDYADFKLKQKDYKGAIEILEKGKNLITDQITYLLKLSSLHLLANDNKNAKKTFKNANLICKNALSMLKSIHPIEKQISSLLEN